MRNLLSYLSSRRALIALWLLTLGVVFTLGFLAGQDGVYVRYEAVLISFSLVCVLAVDGARYRKKRRALEVIGGFLCLCNALFINGKCNCVDNFRRVDLKHYHRLSDPGSDELRLRRFHHGKYVL